MRARELARECEQRGWIKVRQRGSHAVYHKPGEARPIIIPVHPRDLRKSVVEPTLKRLRGGDQPAADGSAGLADPGKNPP